MNIFKYLLIWLLTISTWLFAASNSEVKPDKRGYIVKVDDQVEDFSVTLTDGTESQVKIVPFYDRTQLIYETLGTLNTALYQEILVTIIVILVMVLHFRSSILISGLLPIAVLITFIAMKFFSVDANIVALSGIAIAIGTMVDLGIVRRQSRHEVQSR